jgi:23S rRNA (adenine2503-C2)-methyltransferase
VRLALSLHAADDSLRSELMPVNDRYPVAEVIEACRGWRAARRKRVYVEYLMLAGLNDDPGQARELAAVLTPHNTFKVNLIPYNPTGGDFAVSSREAIDAFRDELVRRGVPATVRLTRGRDIDAACGQLAAKVA